MSGFRWDFPILTIINLASSPNLSLRAGPYPLFMGLHINKTRLHTDKTRF